MSSRPRRARYRTACACERTPCDEQGRESSHTGVDEQLLHRQRTAVPVGDGQPPVGVLVDRARQVGLAQVADRVAEGREHQPARAGHERRVHRERHVAVALPEQALLLEDGEQRGPLLAHRGPLLLHRHAPAGPARGAPAPAPRRGSPAAVGRSCVVTVASVAARQVAGGRNAPSSSVSNHSTALPSTPVASSASRTRSSTVPRSSHTTTSTGPRGLEGQHGEQGVGVVGDVGAVGPPTHRPAPTTAGTAP